MLNADQAREIQSNRDQSNDWTDLEYYSKIIEYAVCNAALHTSKTSFGLILGDYNKNKDLIDSLTKHFEEKFYKVNLEDMIGIHILRISW